MAPAAKNPKVSVPGFPDLPKTGSGKDTGSNLGHPKRFLPTTRGSLGLLN